MNKKIVLVGMVFMIFMLCFSNVAMAVAPVLSNESPVDTCKLWDLTTTTVNVTIIDIDSNFNWTLDFSPDIGNNSGYNATNGSKTCTILALAYSTTYTWTINASDFNGTGYINESYTFTTRSAKLRENPVFNDVEKGLIGLMGVVILIAIAMLVYRESQKKDGDLVKPLVAMVLVVILIGLLFSVL